MRLPFFLMACLLGFAIVSCGGEDDEPQIEPVPTPTPTPDDEDPLIIETTTLMGYDWNGYSNDLCMMIIKSLDSNPQITANSPQSWAKAFVSKGDGIPGDNGYYTFYVFANIDKNDSQTARDFKIKTNVRINYQGSTITESEDCSCTQYGYITVDDFVELNKKVAKWQLRSEVKLSKSEDGNTVGYVKNDYFDTNMFLHRSPYTVETTTSTIVGVDPVTGLPINTTVTESIISELYFPGENLKGTFIDEFSYGTHSEYEIPFILLTEEQRGLISISEKELILQCDENNTLYSFYLTALE